MSGTCISEENEVSVDLFPFVGLSCRNGKTEDTTKYKQFTFRGVTLAQIDGTIQQSENGIATFSMPLTLDFTQLEYNGDAQNPNT